jgi:magnesium chelatase family protein
MHLEVTRVPYAELSVGAEGDEDDLLPPPEASAPVRARVIAARERQLRRFAGSAVTCNAGMGPGAVRRYARTDASGEQLLRQATVRLALSARAYHRVLKLARTIADLDGKDIAGAAHVAEALQYRPRVPEA